MTNGKLLRLIKSIDREQLEAEWRSDSRNESVVEIHNKQSEISLAWLHRGGAKTVHFLRHLVRLKPLTAMAQEQWTP
ncbi:MAG: hypothetical protein JAY73_17405, partial [Candidatus Thiodiazotropha taylori]|nr:hypothetical protein [Candidatus Thiodiazotropha taylori]